MMIETTEATDPARRGGWSVGVCVVAAVCFLLQGCGGAETYGEPISLNEATRVGDILSRPADFRGRTVRVEGRIAGECPSGCWFELGQGEVRIHVDLV
jgi:hypothetical protein